MVELNWIAIILAALSTMVVGSLWYGPLFGKLWTRLAKVKTDANYTATKAALLYATAFLGSLVTAIVLATVTYVMQDFLGGNSLVIALETGVLLWLGFTAARIHMHDSFEGRPLKLTFLTVAHELMTISIMALIIGLLPA